nr:MAG TPA: hypothetical protein [Caudoviricetes sp.]
MLHRCRGSGLFFAHCFDKPFAIGFCQSIWHGSTCYVASFFNP